MNDWRLAEDFKNFEDIYKCVRKHNLQGVEIYYLYGEEPSKGYDWTIRLRGGLKSNLCVGPFRHTASVQRQGIFN